MNEKIAFFLLVCLVALSIVYGCGSTALSIHMTHSTHSIGVVSSGPTTITERHRQNVKLPYPGPNWDILGDEVLDPRPH